MRQLEDLGVARDRITAEEQSRNTIENAVFARLIANPKPGERWLLLTSAYHMPRAMAAFRAAGFAVEAYPVDWRTRGPNDLVRPFAAVSEGLRRTDTAVHEWVGLLAYRLSRQDGRTVPRSLTGGFANCRVLARARAVCSFRRRAAREGSMGLRLVIGNKNYSSWSFRPWIAMKVAGIAFEETLISLDAPDFKVRVTALSGAGRVPVLIDGDTAVWESLAILEYLAEKFPAAALWPNRPVGARPRPGDLLGNACRISAAAAAIADERAAAGDTAPARPRRGNRRRPHRCDLERVPFAFRGGRAVSLWCVLRRRCHVCSGRFGVFIPTRSR